MRISRDVVNLNGGLLLAEGVELTSSNLRRLKMWGIDAVHVVGDESGDSNQDMSIAPALRQAAEARVNQRLKHLPADTPALAAWKELAVRRTASRLASESPKSGTKQDARTAPASSSSPPSAAPSEARPRSSSVSDFVRQTRKLPSLPEIYYDLVRETRSSDASVDAVSGIIRKDQSLALRVLRLANSAFYALPMQIGTLDEAVQLIGLREIQNLVLATSVIEAFENVPSQLVDVPSFWQHSIACAAASALLAEEQQEPLPERFFVGGLLHDIGRLVMFLNSPDASRDILCRCVEGGRLSVEVEREILGFEHAEVGAELIVMWRLPNTLGEIVVNHHHPTGGGSRLTDAFLIHYADFITSTLEFGNSGEPFVSPLIVPPSCQRYLLDESRMAKLVHDLEEQCNQVFSVLGT